MPDWEVTIKTQSNYIKTVKVDNCFDRRDAEFQALSSTGAKEVIVCNPIYQTGYKNYRDDIFEQNNNPEVVEVHHYHKPEEDNNNDEEHYQTLDKMEEEMYDLMCQIAMSKGEKLPTIKEFYNYLGK